MNIAFVYYSHTGHTLKVADHLAASLEKDGHNIAVFPIKTVTKIDFQAEMVPIEAIPEIDEFDLILLGSPVHGARISAPIRTFLCAHETFDGKKIILFLTHLFRKGWGADQAIESVQTLCQSKGAAFIGAFSVKWLSFQRKQQIDRVNLTVKDMVNQLSDS